MSVELFRDFWWLAFPLFGFAAAVRGMISDRRRADEIMRQARRGLEGGR